MKKIHMKSIILTGKVFVAALLVFLTVQFNSQALADTNPVSISTTPDTVLFELENLKPGDWAERNLTIQNRGTDFTYQMKVENINSPDADPRKLFNILKMEVKDGNDELLYEGDIAEFTGFEPRYLEAGFEEDLTLEVRFPTTGENMNEYQGLSASFEFHFVAEEVLSDGEPEPPVDEEEEKPTRPIDKDDLDKDSKDGQILPETATNSFNYLLIGVLVLLIGATMFVYSRRKKRVAE
ncbi:TasA family protein [Evansella tamaricis]|uniref:M73 family metallopeptidase n=1 Tax=Evansella tamaricis TaxID=2069301 RepID=A0ABS6JEL5_9BACI|nr:TasA family protein [Evansella tamaricis]MBU9712109.1 M73 family metallopeptidase [Evansella tamaricis]